MREPVTREIKTTFASKYHKHISLEEALQPDKVSATQSKLQKFVRISMYFVLSGIAASGLGIGFLFWLGYKNCLFIEIIIRLHELLFSSVVWLISIHMLAATYHWTQNDFVWNSVVPFLKENDK